MQKLIKYLLYCLIAIISLVNSQVVFARATLSIEPNMLNVSLTANAGSSVDRLIAGDNASFTYFVNDRNQVFISNSNAGERFVPVSYIGGSPTGTVLLLAGDGNGHMYFTTSSNEIWQNANGGAFTRAIIADIVIGGITQLIGDGSYGNMYFATASGQLWNNVNGGAFTLNALTGSTLTGSIEQIVGDGIGYTCFLTSTSQVWCGFAGSFSPIVLSDGSLSGSISQLVGVVNTNLPAQISFYTTTNQVWQQEVLGTTTFGLAMFNRDIPTGNIQQMASDGNGNIFFVTSTAQIWKNTNGGVFDPVALKGDRIFGAVNLLAGHNGYLYFATSNHQLWCYSGSAFSLLTIPFTGNVTQFSGNGDYMYLVTSTNEIWASLNGTEFSQVTYP